MLLTCSPVAMLPEEVNERFSCIPISISRSRNADAELLPSFIWLRRVPAELILIFVDEVDNDDRLSTVTRGMAWRSWIKDMTTIRNNVTRCADWTRSKKIILRQRRRGFSLEADIFRRHEIGDTRRRWGSVEVRSWSAKFGAATEKETKFATTL